MSTKASECWTTDPNARAIRVEASPDRTLLLPFDQFLYSELTVTDTGQHLRFIFASHEVSVTGTGLRRIEAALQRMQLSYVACVPTRFHPVVADEQPVIRQIVVTEAKDKNSPAAP